MKKAFLVFGAILLLLGLVLLFAHRIPVELTETAHETVENQWSLSKTISVPTNISLSFRPSSEWSIPGFEEPIELPPGSGDWYYSNVKELQVNITNPQGNSTAIGIYLVCDPYGASPVTMFPDYFAVLSQDGGVTVDAGYPRAGYVEGENVVHLGRVSEKGIYTVALVLPYELQDMEVVGSTDVRYDYVSVKDSGDNTLFEDEFNDYNWTTDHWVVRNSTSDGNSETLWSVSDGQYKYYSSDVGGIQISYAGDQTWTDYTVEANATYRAGMYGPQITARLNATSGSRYSFGVYPDARAGGPNKARLLKFQDWSRSPIQLGEAGVTTDTNWHNLKMKLNGGSIKCYYDGIEVINVVDYNYTSGLIGLQTDAKAAWPWQHSPAPPEVLSLYETVSNPTYPYSQLLYAGSATMIVGAVVTGEGIRRSNRRKIDSRRKAARR